MKKAGGIVALFGLVLCIASFGLFGREIIRAVTAHEVASTPLEPGSRIATPPIRVDTEKLCLISVKGTIRSQHSNDDVNYRYPFQYTVYDANGNVLVTENRDFSNDAQSRVTRIGQTANVVCDYKRFKVPPPGTMRVEAQIDADTTYRTTATDLRLVVSDGVSERSNSVLAGCAAAGGGLLAMVGGLILFLIGVARARKTHTNTGISKRL
jgi:hypothetical protein